MDTLFNFFTLGLNFLIHIDKQLLLLIAHFGPHIYVILFLIVFCETGLVVTPFLPGDSLLFASGALASAADSSLGIQWVWISFFFAAVFGDMTNYTAGYLIGPKVFCRPKSWFFNTDHLFRAQRFYETHGGKTVFIARYVPIIRTFAPFVAGIGKMRFTRFVCFSVTGTLTWVSFFVMGGYFFGNAPFVRDHLSVVMFAIIIISIVPITVEWLRQKIKATGRKESY